MGMRLLAKNVVNLIPNIGLCSSAQVFATILGSNDLNVFMNNLY